jgi:hypothetical protein
MDNSELGTFVQKFRRLWKSGLDAHLDIDTHAGQAWVSLRVRLGQAPGPLQPHPQFPPHLKRTRDGPSRQRRRARRAAEQAVKAGSEEAHSSEVEAEEAVQGRIAEETIEHEAENAQPDEMADCSAEVAEEILEHNVESTEEVTSRLENEQEAVSETRNEPVEETVQNDTDTADKTSDEPLAEPHVEPCQDNAVLQPEETTVFATVVIENSKQEELYQTDLNSLQDLIFRENHLRENIAKLEFGQLYTRKLRNNCKHTLELKLSVKARNLWEHPKSYIWKHFGRNEWAKPNGSKVTFNRIHVK